MKVMDKALRRIGRNTQAEPLIIKEVLERKLGDHFFRSHRGYLVNLQEVARYDNSNIELKSIIVVLLDIGIYAAQGWLLVMPQKRME